MCGGMYGVAQPERPSTRLWAKKKAIEGYTILAA